MPADPWCCEPTILLDNLPMTLGNMRANGVRMLAAWCLGRGWDHDSILGCNRQSI